VGERAVKSEKEFFKSPEKWGMLEGSRKEGRFSKKKGQPKSGPVGPLTQANRKMDGKKRESRVSVGRHANPRKERKPFLRGNPKDSTG